MIFLVPGLFEDLAHMCADHGVRREHQRGLALGRVDFLLVDMARLLLRSRQDVTERAESVIEVLGEVAWDDFKIVQTDLCYTSDGQS